MQKVQDLYIHRHSSSLRSVSVINSSAHAVFTTITVARSAVTLAGAVFDPSHGREANMVLLLDDSDRIVIFPLDWLDEA